MFSAQIEDYPVADIRAAWQTGTPLGNDRFREQIEAVLGCEKLVMRIVVVRFKPIKNLSDSEIAVITGLSVEQIQRMRIMN